MSTGSVGPTRFLSIARPSLGRSMQVRVLVRRGLSHPILPAGPFAAELQEQRRRAALTRDMPTTATPPTVVGPLVDKWQGAATGAWS